MAGTTPNLGLYLPGGGSTGVWVPDEVADVDPINQNFQKVDQFAGTVGVQANRNQQFYGPASAISSVAGMKLGDEYQESDGGKTLWRYDGSNWVVTGQGRSAKLVKTNGFQVISNAGAVVTGMVAQILHAGYTWDAPTNMLTVTDAGTYLITVQVYGSGGDLNLVTVGFSDTQLGPTEALPSISLLRTSAAVDDRKAMSGPYVLTAGQKLRLVAVATAGGPNIWGGAGNTGQGTHFSIVRLGPAVP